MRSLFRFQRHANEVLATSGIERTSTTLGMKTMLPYRVRPLIERRRRERRR